MRYTVDLKHKSIHFEYEKEDEKELAGYQAALKKVYEPKGYTFTKSLIQITEIPTAYGNYTLSSGVGMGITNFGGYGTSTPSGADAVWEDDDQHKYEWATVARTQATALRNFNLYNQASVLETPEADVSNYDPQAYREAVKETTKMLKKLNETI